MSGTAALILSRDPSLSPEQVRRIIADTASPAATTVGVGAGVIDPVAAVARTGVDRGIRADGGDATTGAASAPTPPAAADHVPSHRIAALGAMAVIAVVARAAWSGGTVRDDAVDQIGAPGRAAGNAVRSRPMPRSS